MKSPDMAIRTGIKPVSFDVYHDEREASLAAAALECLKVYIIRLRHPKPTSDTFAYELDAGLVSAQSYAGHCLVKLAIFNEGLSTPTAFVSGRGILFEQVRPMLEAGSVIHPAEFGYFVRERSVGEHPAPETYNGYYNVLRPQDPGTEANAGD